MMLSDIYNLIVNKR